MATNPNLISEDKIPANWVPLPSKPVVPGAAPAAPVPNDMPQFFSGSLPPALQHDSSFVGTEVGTPRIPKYSLMPLGNQGSPFTNAAAQSTAAKTIAVTPPPPSTTPATSSSITLNIPNIFTPLTQTVTLPGPLAFTLATQPPGTYFSVPGGSLVALETFTTGTLVTNAAAGGTLSLSATPTSSPSWALFGCSKANTGMTTPSGFTAFTGNISFNGGFFGGFTGTSAISVAETVGINSQVAGVLALFAGSVPTIVQQAAASFLGTTPLTKAFTANNTAGNTIIVIVSTTNSSFGAFSLSVSDSAGNAYTTIGYAQSVSSVWAGSVLVAIATNIAGSANTVSANITGRQGGGFTGVLEIIEFPALTAAASIPVFKPIIPSDLPPINLNSGGNGGVSGILPTGKGGTGADNSTNGGPSMFLSQLSTGAAITPTQPDFGDLAGLNKALKYNNVSLVGNGLPSIVALADKTAQTAAIATTTLYAVPTTQQYRISWNAKVTTVAGTSSTLGALTITYTDADATVQTITMGAQNSAGVTETTDSGNTTTTVMLGHTLMLNCRSGTNITYAFAYASNPANVMAYNLHIKLESI